MTEMDGKTFYDRVVKPMREYYGDGVYDAWLFSKGMSLQGVADNYEEVSAALFRRGMRPIVGGGWTFQGQI